MTPWVGSALFVFAIALAIALHEWGHFATARLFGMRAEKFFVGFGPTLWSTRRGETEFGVKWLPLGGFVRIVGMSPGDRRLPAVADEVLEPDAVADDRRRTAETTGVALAEVAGVPDATWRRLEAELARRGVRARERAQLVADARAQVGGDATPAEAAAAFTELVRGRFADTGRVGDVRHRILHGDHGRFFHDRPAWQRAVVLAAGSTVHFVIAVVALFVAFWSFDVQPLPAVEEVLPGSPAAEAGLAPGDRIVAVAGEPVDEFAEAKQLIEARRGEPIALTVERAGQQRTFELTTALQLTGVEAGDDLLEAGFQPLDRVVAVEGDPAAGVEAITRAAEDGTLTVTVERLTSELATRRAEVTVEAELADDLADALTGLVGFVPAQGDLGPVEAFEATFRGEGSFPWMVARTFEAFGDVFGPEGLGAIPDQLAGAERDATGGASLVGITQIAGEGTARAGALFLLGIIASLNVFVGIFNLLPLPPLDGGHLAVLGVERAVNAFRRARGQEADYRVDPRTVTAIAIPVIVFVGLVAIAFLILDLTNPLQLPQ